jgi:hypothetical protein
MIDYNRLTLGFAIDEDTDCMLQATFLLWQAPIKLPATVFGRFFSQI